MTCPVTGEFTLGNYEWSYNHIGENHRRYATLPAEYTLSDDKQSLTFRNPPHHRPYLISRPIELIGHTCELHLHADINLINPSSSSQYGTIVLKYLQSQEVKKAAEFTMEIPGRVRIDTTLTVTPALGCIRIALELSSHIQMGTIENLALRYHPANSSDLSPLPRHGLTVSRRIYTANEAVDLIECAPGGADNSYLWSIEDHTGQKNLQGVWEKDRLTTLDLGALPIGWYRLDSSPNITLPEYQTQTVFLVVPDTNRTDSGSKSAFGIHVEMNAKGLHTMELLGAGWVRLHGADILKWKSVEPDRGEWNWPDSAIAMFTSAGKAILADLGQTPDWASGNTEAEPYPHASYYFGAAAYLPEDILDWENYVGEVVGRYQDQIRHWEVWNEPDIHFLVGGTAGKADDYMSLLASAYRMIKNVDPDLNVLAPAVAYLITPDRVAAPNDISAEEFRRYRDPDFFRNFTNLNPGLYLDVFSFHHYSRIRDKRHTESLALNKNLESLAGDMSTWFGESKEVWLTEYNVLTNEPQPDPGLDSRLARQLCLDHFDFFARGITKVFTYNAMYKELWFSPFDNFYRPPAPTQVFVAYAFMTYILDGLDFDRLDNESVPRLTEYIFKGEFKPAIHIFAAVTGDAKFTIPGNGTIFDYLGKQTRVRKDDVYLLENGNFVYYKIEPVQ